MVMVVITVHNLYNCKCRLSLPRYVYNLPILLYIHVRSIRNDHLMIIIILFIVFVVFVVNQMAAGRYHALAVDDCGHLYSWGSNGNGQLGDGTTNNRYTPVHKPDKAYKYITPCITVHAHRVCCQKLVMTIINYYSTEKISEIYA